LVDIFKVPDAAADLKHFPASGKQYLDNLEDRLPLVIAGSGIGFEHYFASIYPGVIYRVLGVFLDGPENTRINKLLQL